MKYGPAVAAACSPGRSCIPTDFETKKNKGLVLGVLVDTHWASRNFGSASKHDLCPDTNLAVSAAEDGGTSGETPSSAIASLLTVENRGRFFLWGGGSAVVVVTAVGFSVEACDLEMLEIPPS